MRHIIILIVMTILRFDLMSMDCGSPPLPHSTNLDNIINFVERYEEYSVIRYECDTPDKELIGDSTLRCFNGRWVGKSPKCANPSNSKVTNLRIYEGKSYTTRYLGFLGSKKILSEPFHGECYKPAPKWNITSYNKFLFEIETNSQIDYFSLFLFGNDFMKNCMNGNLILIARIERPRKRCVLERVEINGTNSNKTKISFKCFRLSGEISIQEEANPIRDSIRMISLEIESNMNKTILVEYCSLKTFSFDGSCGLPERPLHSLEVNREESFIEFSCEEDFYLEPINSQKVICGSLGDWNKPFPQCLAKTYCRFPTFNIIDHYIHVEYKNLNYLNGTPYAETNSFALYSCGSGNKTKVELIGNHKRVCIKGFWSGSQPKCSEIPKIMNKPMKIKEFDDNRQHLNVTNTKPNLSAVTNDTKWHKLNLVIISMLVSFLIGASFLGFIVFILMKYLSERRSRRMSTTNNIPSLIVSEPNHYYERNTSTYEEYRYESLRLNALELLDLQRINSLYQSN